MEQEAAQVAQLLSDTNLESSVDLNELLSESLDDDEKRQFFEKMVKKNPTVADLFKQNAEAGKAKERAEKKAERKEKKKEKKESAPKKELLPGQLTVR